MSNQENLKIPPVETVSKLQSDFNDAIFKFKEVNTDIDVRVLMPVILDTMFTFPYAWFQQMNQPPERFVEAIATEAQMFCTMMTNPVTKTAEDSAIV